MLEFLILLIILCLIAIKGIIEIFLFIGYCVISAVKKIMRWDEHVNKMKEDIEAKFKQGKMKTKDYKKSHKIFVTCPCCEGTGTNYLEPDYEVDGGDIDCWYCRGCGKISLYQHLYK